MEIRQLHAFITLADTLNFTRSAELLHISQSALSKQLASLESELGVYLLERDTHSTCLTDAGMAFLGEARKVLEQVDKAAAAAVVSKPSDTLHNVNIGFETRLNSTASLAGAFMRLYTSFHNENPDASVRIFDLSIADIHRAFSNDELDMAFVMQEGETFSHFNAEYFNTVDIKKDRFVFLFPTVRGENYSSDNLSVLMEKYNRVFVPQHHATFSTAFELLRALSVYPSVQFSNSFVDTLIRVSLGQGFTFCPEEQFRMLNPGNITAVACNAAELSASMVCVWKKSNRNRSIQSFLSAISE